MSDDRKFLHVPVGDAWVPFSLLDRYVKHNLESHDDDIMGWDMLHGAIHRQISSTVGDNWGLENDRALEVLVDELSACPTCHEVPLWSNKWFCAPCSRQVTIKDVGDALQTPLREKGREMTIEEYRKICGKE